jgi:hypothetical protein
MMQSRNSGLSSLIIFSGFCKVVFFAVLEKVTRSKPTETGEGEETRTCSRCGDTETNVIPAGLHNWSDWEETTAPTCTTEDVETRYCLDDDCNGEIGVAGSNSNTNLTYGNGGDLR